MQKLDKQEIVKKYAKHDTDTGSTEVQVALITSRVNGLTEHMKANKNDNHSRRGLLMLVSQRRRLLNYLKKSSFERYKNIVSSLGLRK